MMYAPWEIANETGWILDTPFGQSLRSITEGMSEANYARLRVTDSFTAS